MLLVFTQISSDSWHPVHIREWKNTLVSIVRWLVFPGILITSVAAQRPVWVKRGFSLGLWAGDRQVGWWLTPPPPCCSRGVFTVEMHHPLKSPHSLLGTHTFAVGLLSPDSRLEVMNVASSLETDQGCHSVWGRVLGHHSCSLSFSISGKRALTSPPVVFCI